MKSIEIKKQIGFSLFLIIFMSLQGISQTSTTSVLNSEQLFSILKSENQSAMRTGFCHTFEVTVDLQFVEVTTTVTFCCSTQIYGCIPIPGNHMDNNGTNANSISIIESNEITVGRNTISIKPGRYKLNQDNEITDLKYLVTKR